MPRFIAVIHSWFMDSEGFEVHELEATYADSAELEARRLTQIGQSNFKRRAFQLIEISSNERISPRKLTWRERLTGRLSQ